MYSKLIIDKSEFALSKAGRPLKRRSIDESRSVSAKLESKFKTSSGKPAAFTTVEQQFIKDEVTICRIDFRYWSDRYGKMMLDAGGDAGVGVAPADLWQSQERALEIIAAREESMHEEIEKHGFTEGIFMVWHKTRQQGATALARLIWGHRVLLNRNIRSIAASLDNTKVHELYTRDKIILEGVPFFMRPELEYDVKDSHIKLAGLNSAITYQQANQESGIGTSQQFDMSHMTELALWPNAYRLEFDFLPAVPKAKSTFVGYEGTANGRGDFWHGFTENVRHRARGYEKWVYAFTPWYVNSKKNRAIPASDWRPSKETKRMADLVERTSAEFAGHKIDLTWEQLYWWETEYEFGRKQGTLHFFFSNYPTTPEQSFQHTTRSALPVEAIEYMRTTALMGMPYDVEVFGAAR